MKLFVIYILPNDLGLARLLRIFLNWDPLKYMENEEDQQKKDIRKLTKKEPKDERHLLPINSIFHVA